MANYPCSIVTPRLDVEEVTPPNVAGTHSSCIQSFRVSIRNKKTVSPHASKICCSKSQISPDGIPSISFSPTVAATTITTTAAAVAAATTTTTTTATNTIITGKIKNSINTKKLKVNSTSTSEDTRLTLIASTCDYSKGSCAAHTNEDASRTFKNHGVNYPGDSTSTALYHTNDSNGSSSNMASRDVISRNTTANSNENHNKQIYSRCVTSYNKTELPKPLQSLRSQTQPCQNMLVPWKQQMSANENKSIAYVSSSVPACYESDDTAPVSMSPGFGLVGKAVTTKDNVNSPEYDLVTSRSQGGKDSATTKGNKHYQSTTEDGRIAEKFSNVDQLLRENTDSRSRTLTFHSHGSRSSSVSMVTTPSASEADMGHSEKDNLGDVDSESVKSLFTTTFGKCGGGVKCSSHPSCPMTSRPVSDHHLQNDKTNRERHLGSKETTRQTSVDGRTVADNDHHGPGRRHWVVRRDVHTANLQSAGYGGDRNVWTRDEASCKSFSYGDPANKDNLRASNEKHEANKGVSQCKHAGETMKADLVADKLNQTEPNYGPKFESPLQPVYDDCINIYTKVSKAGKDLKNHELNGYKAQLSIDQLLVDRASRWNRKVFKGGNAISLTGSTFVGNKLITKEIYLNRPITKELIYRRQSGRDKHSQGKINDVVIDRAIAGTVSHPYNKHKTISETWIEHDDIRELENRYRKDNLSWKVPVLQEARSQSVCDLALCPVYDTATSDRPPGLHNRQNSACVQPRVRSKSVQRSMTSHRPSPPTWTPETDATRTLSSLSSSSRPPSSASSPTSLPSQALMTCRGEASVIDLQKKKSTGVFIHHHETKINSSTAISRLKPATEGTHSTAAFELKNGYFNRAEEMIDYFWSYQGMGRQILGLRSNSSDTLMNEGTEKGEPLCAYPEVSDQGEQPKKNDVFPKLDKLPPIIVSDYDNESFNYAECLMHQLRSNISEMKGQPRRCLSKISDRQEQEKDGLRKRRRKHFEGEDDIETIIDKPENTAGPRLHIVVKLPY